MGVTFVSGSNFNADFNVSGGGAATRSVSAANNLATVAHTSHGYSSDAQVVVTDSANPSVLPNGTYRLLVVDADSYTLNLQYASDTTHLILSTNAAILTMTHPDAGDPPVAQNNVASFNMENGENTIQLRKTDSITENDAFLIALFDASGNTVSSMGTFFRRASYKSAVDISRIDLAKLASQSWPDAVTLSVPRVVTASGIVSTDMSVDFKLQWRLDSESDTKWKDTGINGNAVAINALSGSSYLYRLPERTGAYGTWNSTSGRIPSSSSHIVYRLGLRDAGANTGFVWSEGFPVGRTKDWAGLNSSAAYNTNPPRGYPLGTALRHVASDDNTKAVIVAPAKREWGGGNDLWAYSNVINTSSMGSSLPA